MAEPLDVLHREQVARAAAERLAQERDAVLRSIPDGVVVGDPAGRITYLNPAARGLFGLSNGALSALPQMLAADGTPCRWEDLPLVRAAQQQEVVIGAEWRVRRLDGTEVTVQGGAAPVVLENGSQLGAVLVLHDVTAARQQERRREEFFDELVHDLQTPVTTILTAIGVVRANGHVGGREPARRMLLNIELATDRLGQLVDDLLELTRLHAGRVRLNQARCDLRAVARRAAQEMDALVLARRQRLEVVVPRRAVWCNADAGRLERALLNLLSNAQRHGREGGNLRLTLGVRAGEAIFAVADDGPGIPLAEQQRIFDRFYRAAGERVRGSGLGLAIARGIVELHHGRIWVESEPGRGATFFLAVPIRAA